MILIYGVIFGIFVGIVIHFARREKYYISTLSGAWLVFIAVVPQILIFQFHSIRTKIPSDIGSFILIFSQILLLIFTILNIKKLPFWILGIGLVLNIIVIVGNSGWMPISPQNVEWLLGERTASWVLGQRFGFGKDIVLSEPQTFLPLLSDRFRLVWGTTRVLYSLGDVFIAAGAFLYMTGFFNADIFEKHFREVANV